MATKKPAVLTTNAAFKIKSGLSPVTVLELFHYDADDFKRHLSQSLGHMAFRFEQAPIILALDTLHQPDQCVDFRMIRQCCKIHGLCVIAIRGGNDEQKALAHALGLAWLSAPQRKAQTDEETGKVVSLVQGSAASFAQEAPPPVCYVDRPVRAGQQIHAPGDMVVLAPFNAGSELLAGGSVYSYAPLRGRVLAGIQGDTSARILCTQFMAEMVSISGHYKLLDDIDPNYLGQMIQIQLQGHHLQFSRL